MIPHLRFARTLRVPRPAFLFPSLCARVLPRHARDLGSRLLRRVGNPRRSPPARAWKGTIFVPPLPRDFLHRNPCASHSCSSFMGNVAGRVRVETEWLGEGMVQVGCPSREAGGQCAWGNALAAIFPGRRSFPSSLSEGGFDGRANKRPGILKPCELRDVPRFGFRIRLPAILSHRVSL